MERNSTRTRLRRSLAGLVFVLLALSALPAYSASYNCTAAEMGFAENISSKSAKAYLEANAKCLGFAERPSQRKDCPRGKPQRWLDQKKPRIQSHAYRDYSATESVETAILDDKETLTIVHSGCDYYVVLIRMETPNSSLSALRLTAHAIKTIDSLRLEDGEMFNLDRVARAVLEEAAYDPGGTPVNLEIEESDEGDLLQLEVFRAGKVNDSSNYFVEFQLYRGPL